MERGDPAPTKPLIRPHERDGSGNRVGLVGVHGFSSRPVGLARGRPRVAGSLHFRQSGAWSTGCRHVNRSVARPVCGGGAGRRERGFRPPSRVRAIPRLEKPARCGPGTGGDKRGASGQRLRRLAGSSRHRHKAEPPVIPGRRQACPTSRALPTAQRSPAPSREGLFLCRARCIIPSGSSGHERNRHVSP